MKKEFRDLTTESLEKADVVLLGIPYDKGCSCGSGASLAPKMMRELSSYLPPLSMDGDLLNVKIHDLGDFKSNNFYLDLELKADQVFSYNKFPLFLGGDHSISISLEKSFLKYCKNNNKTPVIIHIDAHPDICDVYDGKKTSHACPIRRAIDNGYETKNIVLVGIRGYELQEVEYLSKHKEIKVFNASYIIKNSFKDVYDYIKTNFSKEEYAIYLSYDIDANDPSFAPGTGTPEAFGLNSFELMNFIVSLFNFNICAMDLVEVSPKLDSNNITSWLALKTLYEIFKTIKKEVK